MISKFPHTSMDNLNVLLHNIPPISRYWAIAIVGCSILTTYDLVSPHRLTFQAERAFGSQPWRLLTSFCFFGKLLLTSVDFMVSTVRQSMEMERNYVLKPAILPALVNKFNDTQMRQLTKAIHKLAPLDYFYYMVLIGVSTIMVATAGASMLDYHSIVLGPMLYEILNYISRRTHPDTVGVILFMVPVKGVWICLVRYVIEWVFSERAVADLEGIFSLDFVQIKLMLTSIFAWKALVCISLGHFWWFVYEFLFSEVYSDPDINREYYRNKTVKRVRQAQQIGYMDFSKTILRLILLPPYYWVILYNIRTNRSQIR